MNLETTTAPQQSSKPRSRRGKRWDAKQFEFDFLFPDNPPCVQIDDVVELLQISDQQVRNGCDRGQFMAFAINHDDAPKHEYLRIVRESFRTDLTCIDYSQWLLLVKSVDTWLFQHSRQFVRPTEVAKALRCSLPHVKALYDAQQIRAAVVGNPTAAQRKHLRFERSSVVNFVRRRIEAKCGVRVEDGRAVTATPVRS